MTMTFKSEDPTPWNYELFGCLDDFRLCIATFICPGYTLGRTAEALGEDGVKVGLLYCLGFVALAPLIKWRVRLQENVEGNMITDIVTSCLLPCCSIIQDNRQIYGPKGSHLGEKMPLNQDLPRQ